jgi:Tol biopolymer transport system component
MIRRLAPLVPALLALACGSASTPAPDANAVAVAAPEAGPSPSASSAPVAERGAPIATAGAPVARFLPPLGDAHGAEPQGDLQPAVRIEALPPAPATVVAEMAPGGEGRAALRLAGDHWHALWDTSGAEPGATYRVVVLLGGVEVGGADVSVVRPGGGRAADGIAVVHGRTVPVKFTLSCPEAGCAPSIERVSVDSAEVEANADSSGAAVSYDGRIVAFSTAASNLAAGDANGLRDVFVRDRALGTTTRVSSAAGGGDLDGWSGMASVSADGSLVAFVSSAPALSGGATSALVVAVHDRRSGETRLASVRPDGTPNRYDAAHPALSADGRFVAFNSVDRELVSPAAGWWESVFVRDLRSGETFLGSLRPDGKEPAGASGEPSLSADGRLLAFASSAPDLVAGDANGTWDVFVRDLVTGAVTRASVAPGGADPDGQSRSPRISADGRRVVFQSLASNLVAGDANGTWDVFVHDLETGETALVSARADGAPGTGASTRPTISADGRLVAFQSAAPDLVPDDRNGAGDAFVRDLGAGATARVSVDALGGELAAESTSPVLAGDGRGAAFGSAAATLVPDDHNGASDVFFRGL